MTTYQNPQSQPPPEPWYLALLKRWKLWLPILVAVLALLGVGLTVTDNDGDNIPDVVVIDLGKGSNNPAARQPVVPTGDDTAKIGDPNAPLTSNPVTVDKDQSSDNEPATSHEDLKDEFPDGAPKSQEEAGVQQKTAPGLTAPQPVGGAQNAACTTKYVQTRASREGQKPLLGVLHYTVSKNVPGWGDVNAIWGLFNTFSFAANSTYIMDFEGHCLKLMNEGSNKPWTQGNFNGRSVSIEIIAMGNETRAQWLAAPIMSQGILASLWRDMMRRQGLPLRRVDPVGCIVQQAGWTDHNALECGNSHTDVTPNFPYDVFQKQLTQGQCDAKCERTRSLRERHKANHAARRSKGCGPEDRTKRKECLALYATHRAIHRAAERENIKL